MRFGRCRRARQSARSEADSTDAGADREMTAKDVLAVIIAAFQLFLPLIVALVIVGVVVAVILR